MLDLTLPALLVLAGLPHFGFGPSTSVPPDSLPPAWKPAARFALEDQFVQAMLPQLAPIYSPVGFEIRQDPRVVHIDVDPDSGTVSTVVEYGDIPAGYPARLTMRQYAREMTAATFEKQWRQKTRESINTRYTDPNARPTQGLQFALPVTYSKRVQSILGPGGPALNVSGSENIKLSGQSDWSNQQVTQLGTRKSLFPTLNMQQDLDIRLEGQLSDRVRVNLLQNSANQVPLSNRIAINYRGEEDDLVQELDLGNTNLALPGTQYVSYSGKNEGLFGIKTTERWGPLDFTLLASKQEGRSERASYSGGSSKQQQTLNDFDYIRGQYFFLYDPNDPNLPNGANGVAALDIDFSSIRVYRDINDYRSVANSVQGRAAVDPLRVAAVAGGASVTSARDTASARGTFNLLQPDQDYEIPTTKFYGRIWPVLKLKTRVEGDQKLAVTYNARAYGSTGPFDIHIGTSVAVADTDTTRVLMKLLRAPNSLLKADSIGGNTGDFSTDYNYAPFNLMRELELKNLYQLQGTGIDLNTLKLIVRKGQDYPPKTSFTSSSNSAHITYLEGVGMDNQDETSSVPTRGHDDRVDVSPLTTAAFTGVQLVYKEEGVLFFADPRPFAPRIVSGYLKPFDRFIDSTLINRRAALTGAASAEDAANQDIYDRYEIIQPSNNVRTNRSQYFMDIEFNAAQATGDITLGRGNILEGSEVVTVDGQQWQRDRDYTIDYDLGRVTMKKTLLPGQSLNVDYSYAPLFQQAGRTLVGNAFNWQGVNRNFGGAFMYESRGAQDLRPRIGEEPSRSLIGDLHTDWDFTPDWMTRMVDALPGVRTSTASEMRVQAEMGASFPNPNTANQVYIDDMEGIRDAVSLSMGPERWRWSSLPRVFVSPGFQEPISDIAQQHNAEVHWFSPVNSIKERDLKPALTDAQGAKNAHQSLAISVPRRPTKASLDDTLWVGLTYPLDPAGLDLSRSQFIEVWVNDFRDSKVRGLGIPGTGVKLHIDLGTVSEDEQRSPDVPPNGKLDTEDKVKDNQLTVTEGNNEDTGLDGTLDGAENDSTLDLTTASSSDPHGDDFQTPGPGDVAHDDAESLDPFNWRFTNGTENNKNVNPTPDTEDLDLNTRLDTDDNFFEFTVDLADTSQKAPFLLTDVYAKYGNQAAYSSFVGGDNGWRLYRIPITETVAQKFGNPNLSLVKHARVWLSGITQTDESADHPPGVHKRPLVVLGGLDIVGSRWQAAELDTPATQHGTTVTLNTVNSVDNADIYSPLPFDPGTSRNGSQEFTRREQSLSIEFTQLADSGEVEAYKTFSIDENYSRYGKLNWFVAGFDSVSELPGTTVSPDDSITYFVRFASDELGLNYYEYRSTVPVSQFGRVSWREVKLTLTDLSNLKLAPNFPHTEPVRFDTTIAGTHYAVVGHPSFTRLRRIGVGVLKRPGTGPVSGQLWFDELRATDIAKDRGRAQRVQVTGALANLLNYNFAWNGRGADFLSVGETRGSGNTDNQMAGGGTLQLHRFFEGTGIVLPVTFNYASTRSQPRFSAGDDVVRFGSLAQSSVTRADNRAFSVSYARSWSDRSNPLLRYTLGGLTAGYSQSNSSGFNPNSVDHSRTTGFQVPYSIAPRKLIALGLPFMKKGRFYPLPERFWWNYSLATSESRSEERFGPLRDSLRVRSNTSGRQAFINFGADTRPFDLLHHHIEAVRNLTLPDSIIRQDRIGRLGLINLGRVTSWRQSFDVNRLAVGRGFFQPVFSWSSQYNQNNGPELSPTLGIRAVTNGQTAGVTWDLPFDRFGGTAPGLPAVRDTSRRLTARRPSLFSQFLQHLGTVSTEAGFTQLSSNSRLATTPGPLYLLGLSSRIDSSVTRLGGNEASQALDWHAGMRARVMFLRQSTLNTQLNWTGRQSNVNDVQTSQRTKKLPNVLLDIDYGQIPHAIGIDRLFTTPTLRTTWNHTASLEFVHGQQTSLSTSDEFRPLIGLTGTLRGEARTEFSIDHRDTKRENTSLGRSEDEHHITTVNLNISRSYSRGQKVNVLGKTSTVNSSVTLGVASVFEKETGGLTVGTDVLNPVNSYRLSVSGNGSYGFSTNVTGNLSLGYGQNGNLILKTVNRNVRVEARAQFTF